MQGKYKDEMEFIREASKRLFALDQGIRHEQPDAQLVNSRRTRPAKKTGRIPSAA